MRNNLFFPVSILLAGTLLAGAACSFKLNVPPGQVLCKQNSDCPSGATCEAIRQDAAPITVSVCCLKPGCAANLSADIVSAAVAAAYQPPQDASSSEVSGSAEVGVSADAQVGPEAQVSGDSGVGPEAQTLPDAVVASDVLTSPDLMLAPAPDALAAPDVILATDALVAGDVFAYPDTVASFDAIIAPEATISLPDVGFGPEAQIAYDVSPPASEVGSKMDVLKLDLAFFEAPMAYDAQPGMDEAPEGPVPTCASGCNGYLCNDIGGCRTSCSLPADCVSGYHCTTSKCIADCTTTSCSPGFACDVVTKICLPSD